ncbi:hypothetical protein HDU83_002499 [Entophlyctis luteolus]|nr:hypothetical protein HDU83_002499 [Entophlyctis luteolus]
MASQQSPSSSASSIEILRASISLAAARYREFDARKEDRLVHSRLARSRPQSLLVLTAFLLTAGSVTALANIGTGGAVLTGAYATYVQTVCNFTFAILGSLLAAPVVNLLGSRVVAVFAAISATAELGSQTYLVNAISRSSLKLGNGRFAVFASALWALAYPMLLTAVASIVLTYPPEYRRGSAIAVAAVIIFLPNLLDAILNVVLAFLNFSVSEPPQYAHVVCTLIALIGMVPAAFLLKPHNVIISGETVAGNNAEPTFMGEYVYMRQTYDSRSSWLMATVIILMAYYGGSVVALDTVSLNSSTASSVTAMTLSLLIYICLYLLGVWLISATFLDNQSHPRQRRARMTSAVLIIGYIIVLLATFVSAFTVYGAYGIYGIFDGFVHAFYAWLISCVTNSPARQARTIGFLCVVYYVVRTLRYILVSYLPDAPSYDAKVTIACVLLVLIMLGAVNFYCVADTCAEGPEAAVSNDSAPAPVLAVLRRVRKRSPNAVLPVRADVSTADDSTPQPGALGPAAKMKASVVTFDVEHADDTTTSDSPAKFSQYSFQQ